MSANVYQQLQNDDTISFRILPDPVIIPALPLAAAINLENAARLRAMQRQGRVLSLIAGGSADVGALAALCEHCGQTPGLPHTAPYTRRPVHICDGCAALDRLVAARTNMMVGNLRVWLRPLVLGGSQLTA